MNNKKIRDYIYISWIFGMGKNVKTINHGLDFGDYLDLLLKSHIILQQSQSTEKL